ncbi:hypothetical protein TrCOL_g6018 [Triparma columacea]|uniref:Uncharacterized protein n=1 Tax=Triparma columacea TaxID=722753 RepID=A0A9W7G2H3_9STRA|nr:hypothetical protein TrCOL_g6018 [Triparma columacea]
MVKRRAVEVIECPSDDARTNFKKSNKGTTFSSSTISSSNSRVSSNLTAEEEKKYSKMGKSIKSSEQFSEMFKEVQKAGSQQFTGYARKLYREDTYKKTVGQKLKRQKVPQNILAGMIRKQASREEKARKLAADAGIVQAKKKKIKKSYSEVNQRNNRIMGPSPSIGFTRGGVLNVKKN